MQPLLWPNIAPRFTEEFDFEATGINETLIRDLASGDFLDHQRNLVLVGGTGTGKTHLAVSIARACIRRGRFFNVVDLLTEPPPTKVRGFSGS